ncbi:MAG: hypothetical protein R3362_00860 [Rhodothermales bacterium]|nr:hypothetical protein [Rhodothermales bacterium]
MRRPRPFARLPLHPPARLLALLALLALAAPAEAQRIDLQPRFGVGFDGILSIASGDILDDGFAIGVRGRASFPVNADFSLAVGTGFAGYLFAGRDDATWFLNPQVSGILTLPSVNWANYFLGGVGGFFPLGDNDSEGGPALHIGAGKVLPLQETSLYIEANPALVIGESRSTLVLPVRVGVIF